MIIEDEKAFTAEYIPFDEYDGDSSLVACRSGRRDSIPSFFFFSLPSLFSCQGAPKLLSVARC